jgi:hypothetical protein
MDSEWLKTQLRVNPEKSKADLARALGLEPPAVSKILAGSRQIKAQEYIAMRRFFGLGGDIERAEPSPARYVLKPLQDSASGQTQAEDWTMPAHLISRRTQAQPEQIRVFPISDSTMAPDFQPGGHVLVDVSDTVPSPPGIFVVTDGLGHMLRQCEVVPQSKPVEVRITPGNRSYQSRVVRLEDAGVVGRVIARLEWV